MAALLLLYAHAVAFVVLTLAVFSDEKVPATAYIVYAGLTLVFTGMAVTPQIPWPEPLAGQSAWDVAVLLVSWCVIAVDGARGNKNGFAWMDE